VVLISAGAPKNLQKKCSPGNPAPKSIRKSEVWLLYCSMVLITAGAPENPRKMFSQGNPAPGEILGKVHTDESHF
jgi:hypothetical protein